jgi:hypothetical protein
VIGGFCSWALAGIGAMVCLGVGDAAEVAARRPAEAVVDRDAVRGGQVVRKPFPGLLAVVARRGRLQGEQAVSRRDSAWGGQVAGGR